MYNFLKNLFGSTAERVVQTGCNTPGRREGTSREKNRFRPSLQLLEDRQLMSVAPLGIAKRTYVALKAR